jgi:hypothetical protein
MALDRRIWGIDGSVNILAGNCIINGLLISREGHPDGIADHRHDGTEYYSES